MAEKREEFKGFFPGRTVFPGGHIEPDETPEIALKREMKEELGIEVIKFKHIGKFYYSDQNYSEVFIINKWKGEAKPIEAKEVIWIEKEEELSNDYDKKILRKIKS